MPAPLIEGAIAPSTASAERPAVGTNLWREAAAGGAQAMGRATGAIAYRLCDECHQDAIARYVDHWIDERHFQWESQNSTSPESSKGRSIIDHQRNGWTIHLFVRDGKLSGGKAAPFAYHGKVNYVRHEGSEPMRVVFSVG